jgi:hypothetical protein
MSTRRLRVDSKLKPTERHSTYEGEPGGTVPPATKKPLPVVGFTLQF